MPVFTSANAAEMGRRSGQARRANPVVRVPMARVRYDQSHSRNSGPNLAPAAVERQLATVREQMKSLREQLQDNRADHCEHCGRGGMLPRDRAHLVHALDGLMETERILLGIPKPGTLKPKNSQPAGPYYRPPPVDLPTGYQG